MHCVVQARQEGGLDYGESVGEMGRDEERETDLRSIHQGELTRLNEGLVVGSRRPVRGSYQK